MKIRAFLALGFGFFCPALPLVHAQTTTSTRPATGAALIGKVDAANLGQLPQLTQTRGAISLGATREELEAAPDALESLRDFVRRGGVVFLHTNAAQLFGFRTVVARRGTNALAGQLLGRARAALPFGSHPLLSANRTQRSSDPARLPGVNVVFYTLREGDVLVADHPAGTPILEVTDLATNTPANRPLYACALAPYGQGLAVVTPEFVDARRADGALFTANLQKLVPQAGAANGPKWIGIPQDALDGEAQSLVTQLSEALQTADAPAPALPPLEAPVQAAPQAAPQNAPTVPKTAATSTPVLLLERGEAGAILGVLRGESAPGALAILRARVAILRGDYPRAAALLGGAPSCAERALLLGILAGGSAAPIAQSSPERAAFAREASVQFAQAATLRPLFVARALGTAGNTPANTNGTAAAGTTGTSNPTGAASVLGFETAAPRAASAEFGRLAQMFALEPPGFQAFGTGATQIVVRFLPGDSSSPALLTAASALANARVFGWRVDQQEILLFPDETTYVPFRRSTGVPGQNVPFPSGAAGDVLGARIFMATIPATPVIRRLPNGQTQVLPPRQTGLQVLARLQAYALLATWLDGGGRVPAWLALGLENIAASAIGAPGFGADANTTLQNFAAAGGLLSPAQFEAQRAVPSDIAALQAAAIVSYFYQSFGAGAVTETVQRLASGQNAASALTETTGGDELALFVAWRGAQFGPQNFPNRG